MKYKHDCFWLEDLKDMGASLYFCYINRCEGKEIVPIDSCPEQCKKYIQLDEARSVIRSWQNRDSKENK